MKMSLINITSSEIIFLHGNNINTVFFYSPTSVNAV